MDLPCDHQHGELACIVVQQYHALLVRMKCVDTQCKRLTTVNDRLHIELTYT